MHLDVAWESVYTCARRPGNGSKYQGAPRRCTHAHVSTLAIAAQATGATLEALGHAAGTEIVTDAHRAIMGTVKPHGAVIKPTGAGGGDLGWVIPARAQDEVKILARLQRAGYAAWRLPISETGLRVDAD